MHDEAVRYLGADLGELHFAGVCDGSKVTSALDPQRWPTTDYNKR